METKTLTDEEGISLADDLICAFKHRDGSITDEAVLRFIDQLFEKSFLPETGGYWDVFLKSLIDHNLNETQKENLVKSAINIFLSLSNWLESSA